MMLSVVVPVFNSSSSLPELYQRLSMVLDQSGSDWEIIMVDDHSEDESFQVMKTIRQQDRRVKLIRLEKNAGQHNCTLCGLEYSQGDYIITIDDDLQNPPEEIPQLIKAVQEGHDVVFGIPREKQHHAYRNWGSRLIDKLINVIIPSSVGIKRSSFRILERELLDLMLADIKTPIYMAALILSHARNPGNVEVRHQTRKYGQSNYNLLKTLAMTNNLLLSYSNLPIKMVGILWAALFVAIFLWLQLLGTYPGFQALIASTPILVMGLVLAAITVWLAGQYWLSRSRHSNRAPLPYVIQEIEL